MNLLVFLLVVAILMGLIGEGDSAVDKGCPEMRLKQCMNHLQAINKDHNLAFATTERELESMCKKMRIGLDCVYKHVTRCFPKKNRITFYRLLEGTGEVIRLLCNKGSFRKRYKLHAPCMKNISTDAGSCGLQYQDLVHSVSPQTSNTPSDTTRKQCCAYHSYLLCVTEVTEIKCGEDAAIFMKEYSEKTAGPLIKNQCKNYLSGSMMCAIVGSSAMKMFSSVLSILCPILVSLRYFL